MVCQCCLYILIGEKFTSANYILHFCSCRYEKPVPVVEKKLRRSKVPSLKDFDDLNTEELQCNRLRE